MGFFSTKDQLGYQARFEAIRRSQAVIEFDLDGKVLDANDVFLQVLGYTLDEVRGRHHSLFVAAADRDSNGYRDFWAALRRGEFQRAEYKRLTKGGRPVWIEASYNPVLGPDGKPVSIIKIATDVTSRKLAAAADAARIAAIGRSQAVIEFRLDGTIVSANANFLATMGYALDEVQGRHHSMFVEPEERDSIEYRQFWEALNRGEFQAAEYKRIGKGGREVWIQATYNPVLDLDGKPAGVVKFATDVTAQKLAQAEAAAMTRAQAVIEFKMDGTILTANDLFLGVVGYSLAEIQGRHHSMFVDSQYRETAAYREFWAALNRGESQTAEFKRIGKGGHEVWLQATYNPVLDLSGKPIKVVKLATDVTRQANARFGAGRIGELMQSMATGAEELSASIREITLSMAKSKDRTTETFNLVVDADQATQQLSDSAEAMGSVVETINSISGQINLLALNATIESARAGEAGKGFAVVANEVKTLARQSGDATKKIALSIDAMRKVTGDVVGSLNAIRAAMQDVLNYVGTTAAAVEQQGAVASQISSNTQRAADEANRIGAL